MGEEEPKFKVEFAVGDLVKINDGPFKDYEGKVGELDESKGKVKVMVTIFGRETPVELDFLQVKKCKRSGSADGIRIYGWLRMDRIRNSVLLLIHNSCFSNYECWVKSYILN